MKTISSFKNIYTIIILFTIMVSIIQLNLLGKGIVARLVHSQQLKITVPNITANYNPESKGFIPDKIEINSVGISLPVVPVPLKKGTWQVYPGVANYAEGTGVVNDKSGNVGIYAHDRTDAFAKIKLLHSGSKSDIILTNNTYRAIYQVQTASVIAPTAIDVFYPTKEPVLTLITCEGIFSEKRYMVRAKLTKIEKIKNK